MIFDPRTNALYADDGEFLKTVHCPMALRVQDLDRLAADSPDRFCHHCDRSIRNADDMTDADMRESLQAEGGDLCIFASCEAKHIVMLRPQAAGREIPNHEQLPVVRTARTLVAIQDAFKRGFRPLIRKGGPTSEVGPKCQLWQRRDTGEVWASGDFRSSPWTDLPEQTPEDAWHVVADWFHYRPDWPFPFAAYLLPPGLELGARVFLEDLIEDIPLVYWNQGDSYRLLSANATWVGDEFEVERDSSDLVSMVVG